jgi:hypothetical protein
LVLEELAVHMRVPRLPLVVDQLPSRVAEQPSRQLTVALVADSAQVRLPVQAEHRRMDLLAVLVVLARQS